MKQNNNNIRTHKFHVKVFHPQVCTILCYYVRLYALRVSLNIKDRNLSGLNLPYSFELIQQRLISKLCLIRYHIVKGNASDLLLHFITHLT